MQIGIVVPNMQRLCVRMAAQAGCFFRAQIVTRHWQFQLFRFSAGQPFLHRAVGGKANFDIFTPRKRPQRRDGSGFEFLEVIFILF